MSNQNQKNYESVNFEDRQIASKEAMKELFEQVIKIDKLKIREMPRTSLIQKSKDYFSRWHKERRQYKKIEIALLFGLAFSIVIYYNIFGLLVNFTLVSFYAVFIYFAELKRNKCTYVNEMLGNISHLNEEERIKYTGIVKSLVFGGESKCKFLWIKFALMLSFLFGSVIYQHFTSSFLNHTNVSGIIGLIVIIINMSNFYKEEIV